MEMAFGTERRALSPTPAQQTMTTTTTTSSNNSRRPRITLPTAAASPSPRSRRRRLLPMLFVVLLLLLVSAPNESIGAAGGFRLCGLKLTMMLNAICKQQLCGGFVLKKKRSYATGTLHSDSSLPLNMASIVLSASDGQQFGGGAQQQQQTPEALMRHHFLPTDWTGDEEAEADDPTNSPQGLRWIKRSSYPYKVFGTAKKSGIATECCSKRCTFSYMKTYCCATTMGGGGGGGGIDRGNDDTTEESENEGTDEMEGQK